MELNERSRMVETSEIAMVEAERADRHCHRVKSFLFQLLRRNNELRNTARRVARYLLSLAGQFELRLKKEKDSRCR